MSKKQPPSLKSAKRAILIVDDNPDMRIYIRSCLETIGGCWGHLLEASGGQEALKLVRSVAVDLVISDIMIRDMDGYALCTRLKTDRKLQPMKVVLVSSEAEHEKADAVGADAFLSKPFNAERLKTCLKRVLNRPP